MAIIRQAEDQAPANKLFLPALEALLNNKLYRQAQQIQQLEQNVQNEQLARSEVEAKFSHALEQLAALPCAKACKPANFRC